MPVRRFFAILNAGRRLEAIDKIDLVDIQSISLADHKHYEHVRSQFESRITNVDDVTEALKQTGPLTQEEHQSNHIALAQILAVKKRTMGHG